MNDIESEYDETEELEVCETTGGTKTSAALTLVVFMASLLLVRWLMPNLVEQVHYSIERGKQRARYDVADERLSDDPLSGFSTASQLVAQRIAPSVVHIDTTREDLTLPDPRERNLDVDRDVRGQGSGVIVTSDGEILTNFHVIQGAKTVFVTLCDDRVLEARVVGVDQDSDLALLQVDGVNDLIAADWGDSSQLENGSMVWAAGSPFGLSKSTTFGIVSATGRNIDSSKKRMQEFVQSDAVVQAGNSGGPLVNSTGQVVGINTAIIGPSFQGVSFSIPSNSVLQIYEEVLKQPTSQIGWLGVRLAKSEGGAQIGLVMSGSPAEKAGIVAGDIITYWGEEKVDSSASLSELVRKTDVDMTVRVTLLRASSEEGLDVKVGPKPLQF